MPYVLYIVLLVILGVALLVGYVYLAIKFKLKIKWTLVPALIVIMIAVISIDIGLSGSKLFIIQSDFSLKTSIIFSDGEFTFSNGETVQLIADRGSYVVNDSEKDYFIEEVEYGVVLFEELEDPFLEGSSVSKVPFRMLDNFGVNDEPIESVSSRNSSGALHYWLREANSDEMIEYLQVGD